jgi:RNA polymerase sigma-70 factor (ECF subfamily)
MKDHHMNAAVLSAIRTSTRDLHRYLMRRIRNPADVDDLAQEIYKRLLSTPDEAMIGNPGAYLYGAAKHVLADFRIDETARCKCVVEHDESDDWLDQPSCILPDDMADRLSLQQQIDRALAQLPPTHAAVLLCHKRDGLSYMETAEKLGLSPFTVEKYLTEAKASLRTMEWTR